MHNMKYGLLTSDGKQNDAFYYARSVRYIMMHSAGSPETSLHIYQTDKNRISQNYNFICLQQKVK